jgi:hypothetical protein
MTTLLLSLLLLPGPTAPPGAPPDAPVDAAARQTVVQALGAALRTHYVFPDVGERTAAALQAHLDGGRLGQTRAQAFAEALTRALRAVTRDGHLGVRFAPDFRGGTDPSAEPTAEQKAAFRRRAARDNFGVYRVQILPGNVGLFDLRGFLPKELSAPAIGSAMALLANTDALVVDLRSNGGGAPETVALVCSYFFAEGSRIHLNDIYDRPKNETEQFWTDPKLPGPRYVGKPVYVLTSRRTFSGAEEFAYNLQTQKRATLVGETTGGGAHPGGLVALGAGFAAFVPTGRAINPLTGTNWEGVGVKPELATSAEAALKTAHLHALRTLLDAEKDEQRRRAIEQTVALVKKGEPPAR